MYVEVTLCICDCLSNNRPSLYHKLNIFSVQLAAIFNSYHYTMHLTPILDWSAFLRAALTLCKCGFDTMAPVERTKWMTSTWDSTLHHGCVHWAP